MSLQPSPTASSGTSADSAATRSSDKDRENRARIQAYYVQHEPFQLAQRREQEQRELQQMVENATREEEQRRAELEAGKEAQVDERAETTITLNVQEAPNNTTCPLNQVPPPFVLPDTTQQLNAPVTTTNALPLIVSSSAESNEDPQVVNVPDATENPSPEQSSSNGSKTDSSLSREYVNSGDKTLNESSSGSGGKLGGILSNWAPAAALKRPLAMNRSLSEFFGLKASNTVSEPADDDRTPPAQGGRRVSHSSTNSDGSSVVEDGKSGILYYRAKDKRGSTDTTGSGWNLGERRSKKLTGGRERRGLASGSLEARSNVRNLRFS
ncbi:hypothetical protein QFC20_003548 [Naganishia adeliensis]|uniref:Uncharacterized protein n=1 Tax=Naganishia adeliensis TaxID=92952 RepID=A0ACC2WA51_9TREE|nr:hypothetical protein QFC20_003548 [Naganishia adeliensis]